MKLVLLGTEEWEALYVNGSKKDEGHSLNLDQVLLRIEREQDDEKFSYQHFYFEPENEEEQEEWDLGIYYEHKLKDVDPHLRQGIGL